MRSTIELARNLGRDRDRRGRGGPGHPAASWRAWGVMRCKGFSSPARPLPAPQCEAWLLAASAALDNTFRVPRLGDRAAATAKSTPRQRLPAERLRLIWRLKVAADLEDAALSDLNIVPYRRPRPRPRPDRPDPDPTAVPHQE